MSAIMPTRVYTAAWMLRTLVWFIGFAAFYIPQGANMQSLHGQT